MLDRIIAHKKEEVKALYEIPGLRDIAPRTPNAALPDSLRARGRMQVIAEVKKASPSKGILCENFDPLRLARFYEQNGAAAISVLTDSRFFQGSPAYLRDIKKNSGIPVLRKDFIIDEIQLYETVPMGADMVLLIAGILNYLQLLKLSEKARALGLEVLLETHDRQEVEMVQDLPVNIIGINNRDLKNFNVSLENSLNLVDCLPPRAVKISESGIKSRRDLQIIDQAGFDAVLLGEALVTDASPGKKLQDLLEYQEGL